MVYEIVYFFRDKYMDSLALIYFKPRKTCTSLPIIIRRRYPLISSTRIIFLSTANCSHRRDMCKCCAVVALVLDLPDYFVIAAAAHALKEDETVGRYQIRTRHVQSILFSINAMSDYQCIKDSRLNKVRIAKICDMIDCTG